MKSSEEFFKYYVVRNPIAHSLWRSFECERFAKEKLLHPVLDVGCGDGFFTEAVFDRKIDIGIDTDPSEVQRAVKRGNYKKVLTASVVDIPLPDSSVKTVISNCVLEHVPEIDRGLSEIARVLKPGGRLMMTVPSEYYNRDSFYQKLFKTMGFNQAAQWYNRSLNHVFKHYHVYGKKLWLKKFKAHGLELETAEYLMSRRAFRIYDRFLIAAVGGKLLKAFFGRWVIFPRIWMPKIISPSFRGVLNEKDEKGIVYFMVARKKG
jgi:ubiquinone/menaquinone biosynthesis C-methylase UbiE